jgi:hypothetical protein
MKYTKDQIQRVKDRMARLPEVTLADKGVVTSLEAITLMADVIASVQEKGYTVAMILKILKDHGIEMSLSTLRRSLKRANVPNPKRGRKRKAAQAVAPTDQKVCGPQHPKVAAAPPNKAEPPPRSKWEKYAGFPVREDNPDI